jgi:hypothetical protein
MMPECWTWQMDQECESAKQGPPQKGPSSYIYKNRSENTTKKQLSLDVK